MIRNYFYVQIACHTKHFEISVALQRNLIIVIGNKSKDVRLRLADSDKIFPNNQTW